MLRIFKIVALLEGVSYIVLFANMLVNKHNNPEMYRSLLFPVGMAHGILFISYIMLAITLKFKEKWDLKKFLLIGFASIIPFGTFIMERKYLRNA